MIRRPRECVEHVLVREGPRKIREKVREVREEPAKMSAKSPRGPRGFRERYSSSTKMPRGDLETACPKCEKLVSRKHWKEHLQRCLSGRRFECPSCGKSSSRQRDHKCKGSDEQNNLSKLQPSAVALLAQIRANLDWAAQCPDTFLHGLVSLSELDRRTKKLWQQSTSSEPYLLGPTRCWQPKPPSELELWLAVHTALQRRSDFLIYENEKLLSVDVSKRPAKRQKRSNKNVGKAQDTARILGASVSQIRIQEVITTALLQSQKGSEALIPCATLLNVHIDNLTAKLEPPETMKCSSHVCGTDFEVTVNMVPPGKVVDIHHDLGQHGVSQCFGKCEKIWILFPPTSENLAIFATSVGFDRRFAKIAAQLRGGVVIKTTQAESLMLPSGALHITFTTIGGFLGGINYSVVETLPTMSRILIAHLSVLVHTQDHFIEDLRTYTDCLAQTLDFDCQDLLPFALRSWVDLQSKLDGKLQSLNSEQFAKLQEPISALDQLWRSFSSSAHYPFTCACQTQVTDIGAHLAASHMLSSDLGM